MQATLDVLAIINTASSHQPQTGDHHDRGGHDQQADQYAAIEAVFAADADDLWG
jgi:hypothetical protein